MIIIILVFIISICNCENIYKNRTFLLNNEHKKYNEHGWISGEIYTNETMWVKYIYEGESSNYKTIEPRTKWKLKRSICTNSEFKGIKVKCENICSGYFQTKKYKTGNEIQGLIIFGIVIGLLFGIIISIPLVFFVLYPCSKMVCINYNNCKEKYNKYQIELFYKIEMYNLLHDRVQEKHLVSEIYQMCNLKHYLYREV